MKVKSIIILFFFFNLLITACRTNFYKSNNQVEFNSFIVNYKIKRLFKDDTLSKNYFVNSYRRLDSIKTILFVKYFPQKKSYYILQTVDSVYIVDNSHNRVYIKKPNKYFTKLFYRFTKFSQFTKPKSKNNAQQFSNNDTIIKISPDSSSVYKYVFLKNGRLKFASVLLKHKIYHQYEAFTFKYIKQYKFQNFSLKDSLKLIFKNNNFVDIKKIAFKEKRITIFPIIKGTLISGKNRPSNPCLTLYEYWHTSCYPCILSIPDLLQLQEKYPNKLKIIGVNQVDKDSLRVLEFIKKHKITYDIILLENDSLTFSYPTYFLVNSNRKVLLREEGYNKNVIKNIDSIIKNYFKNEKK